MSAVRVSANGVPVIVGVSKAIRDVLRLVDQVAATMLRSYRGGERTGKELIARRLSAEPASRPDRSSPSIAPESAKPSSRASSSAMSAGVYRGRADMLGVIRTAEGGTVFLDEICEIPLGLQPKLLRVLQDQEVMPVGKPIPVKVDARFLAGTNRNLAEMVRRGTFRRDLYHRLNIVRVLLPPLRDRTEDVPVLLGYFSAIGRRSLSPPADRGLRGGRGRDCWWSTLGRGTFASWRPGSSGYVTGLEPGLLLDMLFGEGDEWLAARGLVRCSAASVSDSGRAERQAIVDALERSNFNQRQAARLLQVHRATLARKLKQHNLA